MVTDDMPVANSYTHKLLEIAQNFWRIDEPVPLDVFAEMQAAGMDVVTLEQKFRNTEYDGEES